MNREKPDFYALKAQKEGYPARSVYKLEEINQKFKILTPGQNILDVGSSPGSWSLYALKILGDSGSLVGIDLTAPNLKKTWPNAHFFQGDIFDSSSQEILRQRGPYQVILSDAAPLTTGNRTVDTGRSWSLCDQVIRLAKELLVPGGRLVIKVFQGGDEKSLMEDMKTFFKEVKILKPQSVRKDSFETYFIGRDKK